ncbi:MAG: NADP-dependent malic enzyme [Euryarchaeota archaeon]|nr:NADP-dependent malic enzyme [Euryarchaeota archaeon]MDE1835635.1 NADP-dependent malic enzyme [Euryarchaeota archaeon]MDE1878983.1 NADP-dependent malic enzyme [Euryarchaeota archaeon]MDE2043743.1 NADP-dependent malic enzyme [Thermoplasmata archaeon]
MVEVLPRSRPGVEEGGRKTDQELEEARSREAEEETRGLSERAVDLARHFAGKIEVIPKVPVRTLKDFSYWYTPGIAEVSRQIHKDPELAFELTGRWNTIAIVTDGSRVLGLGDVGPEAALPVMEGKALLFKYLGGVDAFPIPIRTKDPAEIVATVQRLEPALGGVNLEDIASPKCFQILDDLQRSLSIPVWHDDQLGTAAATVAGLLNALELTGRKIWQTGIVLLGAGAANLATARLLKALNCDMGALTVVDHRGILHSEREDIDELMLRNRWKYELALTTNEARTQGGLKEALRGADVLIAASTPQPGMVKPDWISTMAPEAIVFSLANPDPEVWPHVARDAGAAIVATGRSDFPNQVNNSLIFPPVFRGILDAHAKGIPDVLALEAAQALARQAKVKGLTREHILPTMAEEGVFPEVAASVATKAVELGIARAKRTKEEFLQLAQSRMARPKELSRVLMKNGLLPPMPGQESD